MNNLITLKIILLVLKNLII